MIVQPSERRTPQPQLVGAGAAAVAKQPTTREVRPSWFVLQMGSLEDVVALSNIVGGAANVAMAIAAGIAVVSWRKHIAGQSHHELAKKLAPLLRQATSHRKSVLRSLRWFHKWPEPDAKEYVLAKFLAPTTPKLDAAAMAIMDLEDLIHAQWGEAVQELIETIRSGSVQLAAHVAFLHSDASEPAESVVWRQLVEKPRIAPSYLGPTYERAMQLLTDLAQEFLAGHLGRDGIPTMSEQELKTKRKNIDDEIARLGETEKATGSKALAAIPAAPVPEHPTGVSEES